MTAPPDNPADPPGATGARSGQISTRRARLILALILFVALALRLVNVDAPPLGVHAWRQSDTAGVARNFAREGLDITRPRVDWRGDGSGEVEMEFPLYCWVVGLLTRLGGEAHVIGRFVSIACSLAGIALIARLGALLASRPVGLWAAGWLAALPLSTFYGRAVQPEAMLTMFLVIGLLGMARWARVGGPSRAPWAWLALSWVGCTLACLLKLPVLYMGLPLAVIACRRSGWRTFRHPALWIFALTLFAAVFAWYAHARALGAATGLTFGVLTSGKWGSPAAALDPATWNAVLFQSLAEKHLTWAGFILALLGAAVAPRGLCRPFLLAWLLALIVFVALVPVGNRVHEYYQYPFLPALAFAIALGCEHLRQRTKRERIALAALLVAAGCFSAFRLRQYWSREDAAASPQALAARELARVAAPDDLVIVADGLGPTPLVLYLADRKGWAMDIAWLDEHAISARAARGAAWLVITQPRTPEQRLAAGQALVMGDVSWSAENAWLVRLTPSAP